MIREFTVQDGVDILGSEAREDAELNQMSGPGYTMLKGGKTVACGGIKIAGVGEAWFAAGEEAKDYKIQIARESRAWLDRIMEQHRLWRLFAYPGTHESARRFLKYMQFYPYDIYMR